MPQFTQNGVVYEELPDGNVRVVGYANEAPADPGFAYEGPKAAADAQRAQADARVATSTVDAEIALANAKAAEAQAAANKAIAETGGDSLTPGQKKADETFATDYAAWNAGGGFAGLENKLSVVSDALDVLEQNDTISGPIFGRLPKFLQQMIDPRSQDVRADIEKAIQETLRQTLGAQFTQKEGEAILARTYDPTQQEASNARRARNLVKELRAQGAARDSAARFFEQNGTIKGWTAPKAGFVLPERERRDDGAVIINQPSLADPGATNKSIPIPPDMQVEHAAWVRQNWGMIGADNYSAFRSDLDRKYGFTSDAPAYAKSGEALGKAASEGQQPNFVSIPPVNAKMDGRDQLNASLFNNSVGSAMFGVADLGGFSDEIAGGLRSMTLGTDMGVEIDRANAMKGAMQDEYGLANVIGSLGGGIATGGLLAKQFPKLASALVANGKRAIATSTAAGAVSGAGEFNDNRMAGAGIGGAMGLLGGGAGVAASPIIRSAMGSNAGRAVSQGVRSGYNKTIGSLPFMQQAAKAAPVPQFKPGEMAIPLDPMNDAIGNLQDADSLGLPYALADADPKLRMLAGSVSRKSPEARNMAEQIFEPRARGQADRLVSAIDGRLAPVTDIEARSRELRKAGSVEAGPYYQRAYAQGAMDDPQISSILGTPSGQEALKNAYRIAKDEMRDPTQMGFVLDEATGGVSINDAGRYTKSLVDVPNERSALTRRIYPSVNGRSTSKIGPVDLAGWLRIKGGIRDQGGELKHAGIDNRPRRMDLAGDENKMGPLVSDEGMTFDDAALAAWEAGYFPELAERPTINQFLDAMRETWEGGKRRFQAGDIPEVDAFKGVRAERYRVEQLNQEGGAWRDASEPAGPRPSAPAEAYAREVALPTYETMHMAKRGFDEMVEGNRDAFGRLNLEGSPIAQGVNNLRGQLNSRLGELNPDYAQGNEIFAKYAKRRDALRQGHDVLPAGGVPKRQFDDVLGRAREYDADFRRPQDQIVPEMQRGYATAMADQANKMRLSGNPYEAVFGSPDQQAKVADLFPQGAADFGRQYRLERDMAKTTQETLGGSPTAARLAADGQFDSDLMGFGTSAAADMAGGGGVFTGKQMLTSAIRSLGDTARLRGGQKKADAIAPILFEPDPRVTLEYIKSLQARRGAYDQRARKYAGASGLFGGFALPAFASE